jgi:hypothetical protein
MTHKTTDEIRELLDKAKLDFESVVNKALNAYLPKIFQTCPLTEDVCMRELCIDCEVFNKQMKE